MRLVEPETFDTLRRCALVLGRHGGHGRLRRHRPGDGEWARRGLGHDPLRDGLDPARRVARGDRADAGLHARPARGVPALAAPPRGTP